MKLLAVVAIGVIACLGTPDKKVSQKVGRHLGVLKSAKKPHRITA